MRNTRLMLGFAAAMISLPALGAESIVGTWSFSKSACGRPSEQIRIGPKGIASEGGMNCQFAKVSRSGDTVTWVGHCYSPEGIRRPEEPDDDGEVTATLSGSRLTVDGLGMSMGPLVRCR